MANTNEVEQLNIRVGADTTDATSVVQELLNSFTKLQNGLIQTTRQATKFDGALGTTFQKLVKDLDRLLPEINKLNTMMNTGATGWGEVVNVLNKLNPTITSYQGKLDVINKSIKEQNVLLRDSEKIELRRNREALKNAQERAKVSTTKINIMYGEDKLKKLQEEKKVLQDTYLISKKLGENSIGLESILLQIKAKSKQIKAEEYSSIQKQNKVLLEAQIATSKVVLARNAEASAMATSLGRAKQKSKELIAELNILKKVEQTEESINRIQNLQNLLSKQGAIIRTARFQEADKLQKMNDREADYNNVMSMHSARRALGYTALFAGIGLVTGAFAKGISSVIEYDKALYQFQAILDVTPQKAKVRKKHTKRFVQRF